MGITEQLSELMTSQAKQTEILDSIKDTVHDIKITLHGRPSREKEGLVSRVRELEVWDKSKNKVLWLIGGTIVGGVFGWIVNKF